MTALPPSTISAARGLLSEGWRAAEILGQVLVPVGDQRGGIHLVDDGTWWAMVLMGLEVEGKLRAC